MPPSLRRSLPTALLAAALALTGVAQAQMSVAPPSQQKVSAVTSPSATSQWGSDLWSAARAGREGEFRRLLAMMRDGEVKGAPDSLKSSADSMLKNLASREVDRAKELDTASAELDKYLESSNDASGLIKALKAAVEIQMLTPEAERQALIKEPRFASLISKADTRARAAETDNRTLEAITLFLWLDQLHDISGQYRPDVKRLAQRQEMIRLYAPHRLFDLSQAWRTQLEEKPLPPYNPLNDDFREKLAGIDQRTVEVAIQRAREHVEQTPVNTMVAGGLENLRTMVLTDDLSETFPGLKDDAARKVMLETIAREIDSVKAMPKQLDQFQVSSLVDRVLATNAGSIALPNEALLHEFGNGCTAKLDDYTQIIWPDEVRRFEKNTQGRFVGIGVQIENTEELAVRVVTPIEGTPAQRAGVHPNDIITKVNGRSVFGLSLDQVVDVITGREGTSVVLTVERSGTEPTDEEKKLALDAGKEPPQAPKEEIEFRITRAPISVATVKGWKRDGAREDAWDWFVDKDTGVGYVRLTQFADESTQELDRAIAVMKRQGLKAMILDLRYNPGGLLDQAVNIAQRFLPYDNLPIVKAKAAGDYVEVVGYTNPSRATLARIPVVVLTNEGSASASEIVSGAVACFSAGYTDEDGHKYEPIDAMVLGWRTFGKGSVQNVWSLTQATKMKVTTNYYMLPDDSIIHRRPGQLAWGVEPALRIEMLPEQLSKSLQIRRDADILRLDENGISSAPGKDTDANPDDLLAKGIDLQLEAAKVLLQARVAAQASAEASKVAEKPSETGTRDR